MYKRQGYKKPYWLDSNLYKVTRREVRGTINLPNWWLINSTHKLYVWGRSGKGAKSGYSFSTLNYQNGYTRVLSGSGGDNTVDGIYHSDSLHVSVLTYQYDVWNKTGLTHIGHMPPDNQLGCNISVFGDSVLITSVAESENNQSTITTNLYPNPIKNNTCLLYTSPSPRD